MNRYFILKTGWEMFDLSRAYGLGTLIYALSQQSRDVVLNDKNYWYEITVSSDLILDDGQISGYLSDDLDWDKALITTKRGQQKTIKEEVRSLLFNKTQVKEILNKYSAFEISQVPFIGKGSKTLYGSMEPRSFKGHRESIRLKTSYSEGDTPKVFIQDWLLSIVGHINLTIWAYSADFNELLSVMPTPSNKGLEFRSLDLEIRDNIKRSVKRMHRAGRFPTLAYIGTKLTKNELEKKELVYQSAYQSLLYGSMVATGRGKNKQWKPTTSGIFLLDFLHLISASLRGLEILDLWEDIFKKTNRKGFEDLAAVLANFVALPTLANFSKYINLHTRQFINKKIYLHLYDNEVMREMTRYV
jgi:hypothetical protein